MKKVPFTNETSAMVHLGPHSIRPGMTEMVDESLVRPPAPAFDLDAFLAQSVKDIVAGLSDLTDDQLGLVQDAESEKSSPRKSLVEAIGKEFADREAAIAEGLAKLELEDLSDEDLQAQLLDAAEDPDRLELIQEVLSERQSRQAEASA